MKITPLHDNVLIKQQDESETMYGNIIIPDAGKEKPLIGEVIAVGPGIHTITGQFIETKIQPGTLVAFPSFGGKKISIEGEEYVVIKEVELLVTLEK